MKNKKIVFFLLTALALTGLGVNSCKKDSSGNVQMFLTHGSWQLASVLVINYLGTSQVGTTDTLNTNCDSTQLFTLNTNNTCTYTNFECIPQKSSGSWSLSNNQLLLRSNMMCADTLKGGISDPNKVQPFINTQIINCGQYSLVIQTGDINVFVTSTTRRRIVQYGFVHQITNTQ